MNLEPEELSVKIIEHAIGMMASDWEGKCHQVVLAILKAKLVKGRDAYGLWWGGMSPNGYWADRSGMDFTHHSWIVLKDGRVFDPTRWSFEAVEPYVWLGEPTEDYDEGSNRLREAMVMPVPKYDKADKKAALVLSVPAERFLHELLDDPPAITEKHMIWVANLPLSYLGTYAKDIYGALVKGGYAAFIPIDNRKLVLEEA